MVRPHRPLKTIIGVNAQHLCQVNRTVIVKCLAEVLPGTLYVTQMNKEDLFLETPFADQCGDILAHESKVGLTKSDSVHRARDHIQYAPIIVSADEDAADAAERRTRRVIRM